MCLCMLLLCITIMTSANIKETTVNGIFLYIKYIKKHKKTALTIEDSDTKQKKAKITKKIINKNNIAFGARTKKTPKVVATPLPPLNFRKIENV